MQPPDDKTPKSHLTLFLALVFFLFILVIFTPFRIFSLNGDSMGFTFIELMGNVPILVIAVAGLITIFAALLPQKWRETIAVLVSSLGVLMWVEGEFLAISYGRFDGGAMEFQIEPWRHFLEIAVWFLVLVGAIAFRKQLVKQVAIAAPLLCLGLSIPIVQFALNESPKAAFNDQVPDHFFELSDHQNGLVLVLDTFGGNVMSELLTSEPQLAKQLTGFTFYPDTISPFPTTFASIPSILNGERYQYKQPIRQYISSSLPKKGVHSQLVEEQFGVALTTFAPEYCVGFTQKCFPTPGTDRSELLTLDRLKLFDFALFRAAPHILRESIYAKDSWILQARFAESHRRERDVNGRARTMMGLLESNTVAKPNISAQFRFIHSYLPHPPYVYDRDCRRTEPAEHTATNNMAQSRCALKLALNWLNRLKDQGIYDQSSIFIVSDHGSDFDVTEPPLQYERSRSSALMLFKGKNAVGDLIIDNTPRALLDVKPMLLTDLDIESKNSIKDWNQSPRYFNAYRWSQDGWKSEYLPDGEVFDVLPDHLNVAAWISKTSPADNCPTMTLPLETEFQKDSEPMLCHSMGMSFAEPNFTWTDSSDVSLTWRLENVVDKSIQLRLLAGAFITGAENNRAISVTATVGDTQVGQIDYDNYSSRWWELTIPGSLLDDQGVLTVQLKIVGAISPKALSLSDDPRSLGLQLYRASLSRIEN